MQVLLVGEVVQVQLGAPVRVDVVAGHQTHQCIGRLVCRRSVVVLDLALPFQAATHLDLRRHRQFVGHGGGQGIARDEFAPAVIVGIGDVHVGVAAADLQARRQFAGCLKLDPVALVGHAVVQVAAQRRVEAGIGGDVVLFGVEHRRADIQFVVQQMALDACFVTLAFQRVDHFALGVEVVLGIEYLGVAGIQRVLRSQVVDHARIRRDLAVDAHIPGRAVVLAVAVSAEHACPGDQVQIVGQAKACTGVDTFLAVGVVRSISGVGDVVGGLGDDPVEGILQRDVGVVRRCAIQRSLLGARASHVGAEGQLVFTTAKGERAAEGDVAIQFPGLVLVVGGKAGETGGRAAVAVHVEHVGVFAVLHGGQGQCRLPVIGETVLPLGKGAGGVHVPVHPRLGDAGAGAAVVQRLAAGIGQRQRAPAGAVGIGLLVFDAQSQGVVVSQVEGQQAAENILLPRVAVQVGIAHLVGVNHPSAHIPRVGQRPGDIEVDAAFVPGTGTDTDLGFGVIGGAFAHKVDRGRGVAAAGHQAVGTVQNVHLLIRRRVDIAHQQPAVQWHPHAVVLEVGDVETAGCEVSTIGLDLLHVDPRSTVQHVADTVEFEVIQLLALDAGHALWSLPCGQVQPRGAGIRPGLITLRRVFTVASDAGGGQVQGVGNGTVENAQGDQREG